MNQNIPIDEVFAEIGRLHVQIGIQQKYIAKLEAEIALRNAPPTALEKPNDQDQSKGPSR